MPHDFAFDIKLAAIVRIKAADEEAARKFLKTSTPNGDLLFGPSPDGTAARIVECSVSIDDELENIEVVMTNEISSELDVISLCDSLPSKQKEIIRLVKIEGLSISETAAKTGYSASDIKISVHRALKTLKQKIKDSGYENR